MSKGWTDVTVGDKVVGYVYQQGKRWLGVVEYDGRTGRSAGSAENKTDAVKLVVTAYLRS